MTRPPDAPSSPERDAPDPGSGRALSLPPALTYSAYRLYWGGAISSVAGYNLVYFAQLWLVHELTVSPLYLGLVGAANAGPAFILTFVGGVYADRVDRRKMILGSQLILTGLAAVLAVLNFRDALELWHILVIAGLSGAVSAFDLPARQAFYPSLVDRRALTSAVALNASVWQAMRVAAPAAAGFLIAWSSTSTVFVLGAIGFGIMASVLLAIRSRPKPEREESAEPAGKSKNAAEQMAEGFAYVRKKPEFRFLIGMVMFSSFFGGGYLMLMPIFAVDILDVGARGQGVLLAASGVGSLSVTLWIATRGRLKGSGTLVVSGAALSGLSIAGFAISARYVGSYPLAIGLMFTTGLFTSMYMISIMSALQAMVPDQLRGRIMALYGISWSVMLLGGAQTGLIANYIGAPAAVTIGGLLVTGFALGPALANRTIRGLATAAEPQSFTIGRDAAGASGR